MTRNPASPTSSKYLVSTQPSGTLSPPVRVVVPTGLQFGRSGHMEQSPCGAQEASTKKRSSTNTSLFTNKRVGPAPLLAMHETLDLT